MTDPKLTFDLDRSIDYPGERHSAAGRSLYNVIDWTGQHRGQVALTHDEWAALNPLRSRPGGAAATEYLDRFPPEARPYCDRAYQDGYEDGAESVRADLECLAIVVSGGLVQSVLGPDSLVGITVKGIDYDVDGEAGLPEIDQGDGTKKAAHVGEIAIEPWGITLPDDAAERRCPDCDGKGAHASTGEDCERCMGGGTITDESEAYRSQTEPHRVGYRIAENQHVNVGFYVRPDDETSFSPVKVYPTATEAWAAFDEEAR